MDIYKNMNKSMQRIKTFRTFESVTGGLTSKQKNWLDNCTYGTWTINAEELVDVEGNFSCRGENLSDFKGVRFGNVSGGFTCQYNKLTSLEGAPQNVDGFFICSKNNLTSLEGAPLEVKGNFRCDKNPLQTLVGAPQKIGDQFLFSAGVEAPEFEIPAGQWGPAQDG